MSKGKDEKYTNNSQQRILKTLRVLAGNEFKGLFPYEISQAMGHEPYQTVRDLANLEQAGFAERVPGSEERWRLSPRVVQIAIEYQEHLATQEHRLNEVKQRYGRVA